MPLSEAHAGRSYPPTPVYEITAAKIAEFVAALGDDNPAYEGDSPLAPPTLVAMVAFAAWDQMFADPDLDLELRRIIHADQRFTYVRPLRAGDRVTATLTIDKVRTRARDGVGVLLDRGARRGRRRDLYGGLHAPPLEGGGVSRSSLDAQQIAVGSDLPSLTVRFTRATLVRYAGASGDFNPIHYSDHSAAKVGLPGVIAHGMLTMGAALRVVTDWVRDPAMVTSYFVRFSSPVVVPDDEHGVEVRFTARVAAVESDRVSVAIEATSGGQKVLGAARAEVNLGV